MTAAHLQHFLRSEVLVELGPDAALGISWGRCRLPTLKDVEPLRALAYAAGLNVQDLLSDCSARTPMEACNGNWHGLAASLGPAVASSSEAQRATAFRRFILPSTEGAPATRGSAWRNWRGVLTWALARRCFHRILPMPSQVLESFLWDLITLDCSFPVIKGYLDCIQVRHRRFGLPSPVSGALSYARLSRGLQRFQGRQRRFVYPIHRSLVAALLRHRVSSWTHFRNILAAALSTLCCMRPCEGAALQSCDVFFDFDMDSGVPGYRGTAAINIKSRKNDQVRRGHHPRLGRPRSHLHDIVHQLRFFLEQTQLAPRAGCTKRANPHAHCPLCPPLFPLTTRSGGLPVFTFQHPSPSKFSSWIVEALGYIDVNTAAFTGVCARKGGLSTAIEAGVPEVVLWMQSGHAQTRAARRYITLQSPELLYATWDAFGL